MFLQTLVLTQRPKRAGSQGALCTVASNAVGTLLGRCLRVDTDKKGIRRPYFRQYPQRAHRCSEQCGFAALCDGGFTFYTRVHVRSFLLAFYSMYLLYFDRSIMIILHYKTNKSCLFSSPQSWHSCIFKQGIITGPSQVLFTYLSV